MAVHVLPADEEHTHLMALGCPCGPRVDDRLAVVHHDLDQADDTARWTPQPHEATQDG